MSPIEVTIENREQDDSEEVRRWQSGIEIKDRERRARLLIDLIK